MKRKLIALVLAIALIGVSVVSGTLAYLTDSDEAINVFAVGDVDITLTEEVSVYHVDDSNKKNIDGKYFADENGGYAFKGIVPTNAIQKDAIVANEGNTEAYVRVVVIMNNKAATESALTSGKATLDKVFLGWDAAYENGFVVKEPTGVKVMGTSNTDANAIIGADEIAWVYYLKLDPKAEADVFDGLVSPKTFDKAENAMFAGLKIEIYADAIQAEGFETYTDAFKALEDAHPLASMRTTGPTYEVGTVEDLEAVLATGGNIALTSDITVDETLEIPAGVNVKLDLNGKTVTGASNKGDGAIIKNNGVLTIVGDSNSVIKNTVANGDSVILNNGSLTLSGGTYVGSPIADGSYPAYSIYSYGTLIVNEGTTVISDRGVVYLDNGSNTIINGGDFIYTDAADGRGLTSHTIYAYGSNSKLTINGGNFENNFNSLAGVSVICPAGATIDIYGGTFSDVIDDPKYGNPQNIHNYMGYSAPVNVYGGVFDDNSVNKYVASGYKAVEVDGKYVVVEGTVNTDKTAIVVSQSSFDNALTSGKSEVVLTDGTYKMPSSGTSATIAIKGTKDTVIDNTLGAYMDSATVSFEGVTIKGSTGKANGNGSDYAALYTPNVTYTNCTFDGPFRIGRDGAKFINCTFTNLGNDYVWAYGNDATFVGCTFESEGKALLIYSDGGTEVSTVTVTDCTFNATKSAKAGAIANQSCAAIEIDNYGNGVKLTASGNTIDDDFSGEWRIKSYDPAKTDVFVNGTEYTSIAIDGKTMTIDANKNVTVNG